MNTEKELSFYVIEDNLADFIVLEEQLLSTGLTVNSVRHAKTVTQFHAECRNTEIDIIFLDLFLPDSTGLDTLNAILKGHPSTPIIILSGLQDMTVALKALAAGAQDYLIKGDFDHKLLAKTILYSIERKRNMEMLRISNERLSIVSETTNDMVWDWNLETGEMHRNEASFKKVFGDSSDAHFNTLEEWITAVHPDDRQRLLNGFNNIMKDATLRSYNTEFRYVLPDGAVTYIQDRGSVIRNEKGKPIRMIGACQNISVRKNSEAQIRSSEQRYRLLAQNGSDLIGIITPAGEYRFVSPTAGPILGFEPEELIGKNAFDFIHTDDRERTQRHLLAAAGEKTVTLPPFRFQNAQGEWRWIRTKLTNMVDDPDIQGIITTSWDVTEELKTEEELRRLSLVARESVNGVLFTDANGEIIWANDSFTRATGYTLEEIKGKKPGSFLQGPETNPATVKYLSQQIRKNLPFDCEIENYHKDGSKIWLHLQGQPLFDGEGKLVQFFSIQTDITRDKLSQLEIEHHRQQFQALIQNSFDVIEVIDGNAQITYVSPAVKRMFGFEPEELLHKNGFDFVHPDDHARAHALLQKIQLVDGATEELTIRVLKKNGGWRYGQIMAKNLLDNPFVKGVVMNIRDITEQREAETLLQISESNYRLLFDSNPMPLYIVEWDTLAFIEVNAAATQLYGYTRGEFSQMTLFDLRTKEEGMRLRKWKKQQRLTEGLIIRAGEWLHFRKNGEQVNVDIKISHLRYRNRNAMLVLVDDITEKKKLEQQILQEKIDRQKKITIASIRVQEKERELIGRELHDNVNQLLASAKLYVEHSLSQETPQKQLLKKSKQYVSLAIEEIRKLSKALVPPSISDLGLKNTIGDLIQTMSIVESLTMNVDLNFEEAELSDVQKLTIYRIIQEQMTNITKHANATEVDLLLNRRRRHLELIVSDNGNGFLPQKTKSGIGLKNIASRVKAVDGEVQIISEPGHGCLIKAVFPLTEIQVKQNTGSRKKNGHPS